jgi:hypothetical protein
LQSVALVGAAIVTIRSAIGAEGGFVTVVAMVALLLEQLLSTDDVQVGSIWAVSMIKPVVLGAVVLMVIVAPPPALIAPPVHLTVGLENPHVNRFVPDALPNATPGGKVSSTSIPVALPVPMLLAVSVYVSAPLVMILVGALMLTVRSGRAPVPLVTGTLAVAEPVKVVLAFVPVPVAVLFRVVPAVAITFPCMVTVHAAPPAKDLPAGMLQMTLPALCEQLPGEAVSTRLVMPFTWSVTDTLLKAAPPVLVKTIVQVRDPPVATELELGVLVIASGPEVDARGLGADMLEAGAAFDCA